MEGVKNHLESPDQKIRVIGMIVAEKVADLVKVPGQKEKLVLNFFFLTFFRVNSNLLSRLEFTYAESEDSKYLLSLSNVDTEPDEEFYNRQLLIYE